MVGPVQTLPIGPDGVSPMPHFTLGAGPSPPGPVRSIGAPNCFSDSSSNLSPSASLIFAAKQLLTLAKAQGTPKKPTSFSLRASRLCEKIVFFYGF